jgi:hypothetical protein
LLKDACNEFSIALNDKPLFIDAIVNCSAANLFLWHLENNAEEYYHQCCYMIELSLAESGQKETCVMLIKALCNNLDINKVTNLSRTSCVVLFELFLTNIMRNKLQSLGLLKDCICYIESMLGERLVSFFAHLFSKAVDVIYFSSKISKQDYTSLVNSKGISSESDIVIEALIEKKPPENEFEQNDLISKTAYFLANEIVKYWGKV